MDNERFAVVNYLGWKHNAGEGRDDLRIFKFLSQRVYVILDEGILLSLSICQQSDKGKRDVVIAITLSVILERYIMVMHMSS